MALIGGTLTVKRNGQLIWAKGDFELQLGVPKRKEEMATDGRLAGYSEEPRAWKVKGKVYNRTDLDLLALFQGTEPETWQFDLANGQSYVLRNAFVTGGDSISLMNGEVDLELIGESLERVTA
jgi:hypothetical protein